MSLHCIMLVGDEEVRKAIVLKMNWKKLGFEVVGDAESETYIVMMITIYSSAEQERRFRFCAVL